MSERENEFAFTQADEGRDRVVPREEKRQEYHFEEIRNLREPLMKILEQLREHLTAQEYDVVIGDDASGRVPTLVLDAVLRRTHQLPEGAQTLFLAGSRHIHKARLGQKVNETARFLSRRSTDVFPKPTNGFGRTFLTSLTSRFPFLSADQPEARNILSASQKKKALIVTEMINRGEGLQSIIESLKKLRKDFDIATVTLSGHVPKEEVEASLGGEIFSGDRTPSHIYGQEYMSGVRKHPADIHATPVDPDRVQGVNSEAEFRNKLRQSREDVQLLAQELSEWYSQGAEQHSTHHEEAA